MCFTLNEKCRESRKAEELLDESIVSATEIILEKMDLRKGGEAKSRSEETSSPNWSRERRPLAASSNTDDCGD